MNNSIFNALNELQKEADPAHVTTFSSVLIPQTKAIRELETAKDAITKEYTEYKIRSEEIIKNLEKEVNSQHFL